MTLLGVGLVFLCFVLEDTTIRAYGFIFYFVQLFYAAYILLKLENNYKYFFSPSFITILYISVTFGLGHLVVANDIGMDKTYYTRFLNYESISFITAYFLLCNMIVFLTIPFKKLSSTSLVYEESKIEKKTFKVLLFFGLLIAFSFIKIDLSFIGGSGDFSYSVKLVLAIFLVFFCRSYNIKIRFLLYSLILFLIVLGNFESKREIFFILILFIFHEIVINRITIKLVFKQVILSFLTIMIGFYIVILSSIARGYGQFDSENIIDSAKFVIEYLNSETIYDGLAANFELSYSYGNSSNAMNYIYSGQEELLFGSTFLKIFFIPIPRSIFSSKPRSMLDIYASVVSPRYRSNEGGSFPIVVYSELFWNFHLFGLLLLFLLFRYFNQIYIYILKKIIINELTIKSVFYVSLYVTLIQFVRGSGLELWLLYALVAIPFTWFLTLINKIRFNHK